MVDKKKETSLDDDDSWKLDDSYGDGDDWGDWNPDGDAPPVANNREAALAVGKSTVRGAASVYLDPGRRQKLILDALPKEYSSAFESYDVLSSEARDVGREAREQLIKTSKEIKRQARSIYPSIAKFLPDGINDKINGIIKDDEFYGSYNQVDPKEAKIQTNMDEVFGTPQQAQQTQPDGAQISVGKQKQNAKEAIVTKELKDAANAVRIDTITQQVVGMRNTMNSIDGYQKTVTTSYSKKMLELNYRQLFAMQDLTDVTSKAMEKIVPNVERIVHNTGLPDYAKEEFKEIYGAQMKRKLVEMFAPANFARDYSRVVASNSRVAINKFFGTINDQLQQGGQIAALASGDDMGREQSPREQALAGAQVGASVGGEFLARRYISPHINKLTGKLRAIGSENETLQRGGHKAKYWLQNLPSIFNSYAKGNGNYEGAFSSVLNPIMGLIGSILPTTTGEQVMHNSVLDNLDKPSAWATKDSHALTEIIPGFLAKIDQSVRSGFMGSEQPLEQYDYKTNQFITTTEVSNRIRDLVGDDKTRQYIRKETERLVNELDVAGGGKPLSDEDKLHLGKTLDKKIRNGNHFDINDLMSGRYDGWEGNIGSFELQNKLEGIKLAGKADATNDSVMDNIRRLREDLNFTQQRIDAAQQQFGQGAIVRSGAFVANDGRLTLAPELRSSYSSFKGDLELPQRGEWGRGYNPAQPQPIYQAPPAQLEDDSSEPYEDPIFGQLNQDTAYKYKARRKSARRGLKQGVVRASGGASGKPSTESILNSLNAIGATAADKFTAMGVDFRAAVANGVSDALYSKTSNHSLYKVLASITESPVSESQKAKELHPLIEAIKEQLEANNADDRLDKIIEVLEEMHELGNHGVMSAGDFYDETGKRIRRILPKNTIRKAKIASRKGWRFGKKWAGKGLGGAGTAGSWGVDKVRAGWKWAMETESYRSREGLWNGIKDGVRGVVDIYDADGNLIFSAKKLKEKMYYNEAGKVIYRIKDIDGNVYDKDRNIIISKEDLADKLDGLKYWVNGKWHKAGELFATAIKDVAGFIGSVPAFVMKHTMDIIKKEYNKKRISSDVWVKDSDEKSPRLRRMYMLKGVYVSVLTGKAIRDVFDIDGAVATRNGNIVISEEELADPNFILVDNEGKPFKTFFGRIRQNAEARLNKVKKVGEWALGKASSAYHTTKEKLSSAYQGMKGWVYNATSSWGPDGEKREKLAKGAKDALEHVPRLTRDVVGRLDKIYDLLEYHFSGGKVTYHGKQTEAPTVTKAKAKSAYELEAEKERAEFKKMQTGWPFTSDHNVHPDDPIVEEQKKSRAESVKDKIKETLNASTVKGRMKEATAATLNSWGPAGAVVGSMGAAAAGVFTKKDADGDSADKKGFTNKFATRVSDKISKLVSKDIDSKIAGDDTGSNRKGGGWINRILEKAKPKHSFDDTNGDGVRENSFRDIMQKRLAKSKEKRLSKKDGKGGVEGKSGFIKSLLGGLGFMLTGLFKTITTPLHLIGKMIESVFNLKTIATRGGLVAGAAKAAGSLGRGAWSVATSPFKAGGMVAKGASALWGSAGLAAARAVAWQGIRMAGMAAIGVVSSPWVIGGALLAGASYLAYRVATAVTPSLLDQIRYAYYGTPDYDDGKSEDVAKLKYLEHTLLKYTKYDKQGYSSLTGIGDKETEALIKGMGVDVTDKARFVMFNDWLFGRFIPVFLLWTSRAKQLDPNRTFHDVVGGEKSLFSTQLEMAKKCKLPADNQIFKIMTGPFEKGTMTNAWESVKGVFGGDPAAGSELLTGEEVLEIYNKHLVALNSSALFEAKRKKHAKKSGRSYSRDDGFKDAKARSTIVVDEKSKDTKGKKAKENVDGTGNIDKIALGTDKDGSKKARLSAVTSVGTLDEVLDKNAVVRDASYLNAIDAIRVKCYGVTDLDINKVESCYFVESLVIKDIEFRGRVPVWKGDVDDMMDKCAAQFELKLKSHGCVASWKYWFQYRFLTVFLNYLQELKFREPGCDPLNIRVDSSSTYLIDVAKKMIGSSVTIHGEKLNIWALSPTPFEDEVALNGSSSSTDLNVDYLRTLRKTKKSMEQAMLPETSKSRVDKIVAKAKEDAKVNKDGVRLNGDYQGFKVSDQKLKDNPTLARILKNAGSRMRTEGYAANGVGETEEWAGGNIGMKDASVDANSAYGKISLKSNNLEDVCNMISQVAKVTGVDETLLYTVGMLESSMRPGAGAGTSSAKGLYQFVNSTWKESIGKYANKYGIPTNTSVYDPVANTMMAAEYLRAGSKTVRSVSGKKHPSPVDMYMAHFLGPTGAGNFLKALKNDPTRIAAYDMRKAAGANRGVFYSGNRALSYAEIYSNLSRRANKGYSNVARFANKPPATSSVALQEGKVAVSTDIKRATVGDTTAPLSQMTDEQLNSKKLEKETSTPVPTEDKSSAPVTVADTAAAKQSGTPSPSDSKPVKQSAVVPVNDSAVPVETNAKITTRRASTNDAAIRSKVEAARASAEEAKFHNAEVQEQIAASRAQGETAGKQLSEQQQINRNLELIYRQLLQQSQATASSSQQAHTARPTPNAQIPQSRLAVPVGKY